MLRRELPPRNDPSHWEPPFEVPIHRLEFRLGNEAPGHLEALFTTTRRCSQHPPVAPERSHVSAGDDEGVFYTNTVPTLVVWNLYAENEPTRHIERTNTVLGLSLVLCAKLSTM